MVAHSGYIVAIILDKWWLNGDMWWLILGRGVVAHSVLCRCQGNMRWLIGGAPDSWKKDVYRRQGKQSSLLFG